MICVECKKQKASVDYKPFCSKRCADVDLHRWTTESYAIPTDDSEGSAFAYYGEEL